MIVINFCKRFFKHFMYFFIVTIGVVFIVIIFIVLSFLQYIPDYNYILENDDLPITTRVYTSELDLISEFSSENRIYIPIKFIKQHTINAFISAEDKTFYTNIGIDFKGIFRSVMKNIYNFNTDNKMVGGSTITQQVVKNYFLTSEKTLKRKIKEAILSLQINSILTKDQIMELYLNKIFFGNRAYGIASASLKYFNKSVNELTIDESALLASLPQSPSMINPILTEQKSKERRNWVLYKMYENQFITEEEYKHSVNKPIKLDLSYSKQFLQDDFFIEEVRREIVSKYGKDFIYKGGLYIHTTMNPRYQKFAKNSLQTGLIEFDRKGEWRGAIDNIYSHKYDWCKIINNIKNIRGQGDWNYAVVLNNNEYIEIGLKDCTKGILKDFKWNKFLKKGDVILVSNEGNNQYSLQQIPEVNGGIIVVDVNTGKVLSLVGGFDYNITQYNMVTQASRQSGSIMKPIVYSTGFMNHNITPATIVKDEPRVMYQGNGKPLWQPKNYENRFFYDTTVPSGLALSRNMITLQLTDLIGLSNIIDNLHKIGIFKDAHPIYSFVLGAEESTLFDLMKYYTVLANNGKEINLSMIEKIQNSKGEDIVDIQNNYSCNNCIIYNKIHPNQNLKNDDYDLNNIFSDTPYLINNAKQIFDEKSIFQMTNILSGSVEFGTSKRLRSLGINLAAKTGTSNNSKDAWVIGYTPKIIVGVYVGYNNPNTLGSNASGARVALPIFANFFTSIKDELVNIPFKTPEGIGFVKMNTASGELVNYKNIDSITGINKFHWHPFKNENLDIILNMEQNYKDILEDHKDFLDAQYNINNWKDDPEIDILMNIIESNDS